MSFGALPLSSQREAVDSTFIETLCLPDLGFEKLLPASVFAVSRKKQKLVLEREGLGRESIFLYFKLKNVYSERDVSVS